MTALMKAPLRGVPVADGRSTREKMLAGELHYAPDPELIALGNAGRARMKAFNETPRTDPAARAAAAKALFGRFGKSWVESPVTVDYGVHIEIGDFSFINMNCTFLDSARITIGDHVMIATGVQVLTATHPTDPAERHIDFPDDPDFPMRAACLARPIVIGDNVWIGAGAIILPGVTIGSGTTIGAGSVVTRSIPGNVIAAGNPCRVIRRLPGFDAAADGVQPSEWALAG